jgi:hypothetical protein
VGFEPRLSNEINKLEGANGTSNPLNITKTFNSTFYWTLKWTLIFPRVIFLSRCINKGWSNA